MYIVLEGGYLGYTRTLFYQHMFRKKKLNNPVMVEVENMIKFSKDFTKFLIKYNFIPFIGILAFKNIF